MQRTSFAHDLNPCVNTKRKGNRNEHRTMKLLEDQGYRTCRSAASLGLWDVIGVGMDDVVLVQVKTNRKPPAAEMKAIQEFEVPTGVRKFVHIWKDRKREPVKIEIGAESI